MRKVIHSAALERPGQRGAGASGQRPARRPPPVGAATPPGRRGGGGGWRRRPTPTDPTIPDFRCTSDAFQISHKNRAIIAQESRTTLPPIPPSR